MAGGRRRQTLPGAQDVENLVAEWNVNGSSHGR